MEADPDLTFTCREDDGEHAGLFSCAGADPDASGIGGFKFGCSSFCVQTTNPFGECNCEGNSVSLLLATCSGFFCKSWGVTKN